MLSPEQERERALKVAELYGQRLLRPEPLYTKPLNLSPATKSALVLAIPPVAFAALLDIYRNNNYSNLTDVQAASMIFIPSLMAVFAITVIVIRYVYTKLNNSYTFSNSVFWIGLAVVVGFSLTLFQLTTGSGMQSPIEIMARIVIFAVCIGLISIVALTSLVRIFYNRNKS